jgi:hypothetical protein
LMGKFLDNYELWTKISKKYKGFLKNDAWTTFPHLMALKINIQKLTYEKYYVIYYGRNWFVNSTPAWRPASGRKEAEDHQGEHGEVHQRKGVSKVQVITTSGATFISDFQNATRLNVDFQNADFQNVNFQNVTITYYCTLN